MLSKDIKEEHKKYQHVVTEKLRYMLNENEVDVLSDYAWQMALSKHGSFEHLYTELKDFFGEDTTEFVTWLLDYVKDVNKEIKQEELKKKGMNRNSAADSKDESLRSKNIRDQRTLHKIGRHSPKMSLRGIEKVSRRGNFVIRKRSRSNNERKGRSLSRSRSPFTRRGGRRKIVMERSDHSRSHSRSPDSHKRRGHYVEKEERGGKWDAKRDDHKQFSHSDYKVNNAGRSSDNVTDRVVVLENTGGRHHRHVVENNDLSESKKKAVLKPNPRFVGDSVTPYLQPLPPSTCPSQSGAPQVATFGFVVPGFDKGIVPPMNYLRNSYVVPPCMSMGINCVVPDQKNKQMDYVPPPMKPPINNMFNPVHQRTKHVQGMIILEAGQHRSQKTAGKVHPTFHASQSMDVEATRLPNTEVHALHKTVEPTEGCHVGNATNNSVGSQENVTVVSPQVIVKIQKRCINYPNCQYGDSCRYIHPSENCRNWPYCAFGPECIYIHPDIPCKFGAYCCNYYCNYSHNSVTDPASSGMGVNGFYSNKKLINVGNTKSEEKHVDEQVKLMSNTLPKTPPEMVKDKNKEDEYNENKYIENMLKEEKNVEAVNQMTQHGQQIQSQMQNQLQNQIQNQVHDQTQIQMQNQTPDQIQNQIQNQMQNHMQNESQPFQQQLQQLLEQNQHISNGQTSDAFSFMGIPLNTNGGFQISNVNNVNSGSGMFTNGMGDENKVNVDNVNNVKGFVDMNNMNGLNRIGSDGNANETNDPTKSDEQNIVNRGFFTAQTNARNSDVGGL